MYGEDAIFKMAAAVKEAHLKIVVFAIVFML